MTSATAVDDVRAMTAVAVTRVGERTCSEGSKRHNCG
jgi:hypothetical protein